MTKTDYVQWAQELRTAGCTDDRNAFIMCNLEKAPNLEYGWVLFCLNGDTVGIYDTDFYGSVGEKLYSIDMRRVEKLKFRPSKLFAYIKFTYEGKKFAFSAGLSSSPVLVEALKNYKELLEDK